MTTTTYIYLMGRQGGPWKVGIADDPYRRLVQLQTGCPFELQMYGYSPLPNRQQARALERALHRELSALRAYGEWFFLDPISVFECMELISEGVRTGRLR